MARLRYVTDQRPGIRRLKSGKGFATLARTDRPFDVRRFSPAFVRSRFHRRGPRSGSAPIRADTFKPPGVTPSAASNIAITRTGGRRATRRIRSHARRSCLANRETTDASRPGATGTAAPQGARHDRSAARRSLIRVGNEEYAKQNQSFGLTTLRDRHVKVRGGTLQFQFRGKSGKHHTIDVNDWRLAQVVKQCRDLPGQELFQYLDDSGKRQRVALATSITT